MRDDHPTSRRHMLRLGSGLLLGAWLGGCTPEPAPRTSFDTDSLLVIPGPGSVGIFVHADGGSNAAWLRFGLEYRQLAANRSQGWARGAITLHRRLGPAHFSDALATLAPSGVVDDSMLFSGRPAGAWLAIVASGRHGWLSARESRFILDGQTYDPVLDGPRSGRTLVLEQVANAFDPSQPELQMAEKLSRWFWQTNGASTYDSRWQWLRGVDIDPRSYLAMANTLAPQFDALEAAGARSLLASEAAKLAVSLGPQATMSGANFACQFTVVDGWQAPVSRLFAQNSGNSGVRGKLYFQHAPYGISVSAGDETAARVAERWGFAAGADIDRLATTGLMCRGSRCLWPPSTW